MPSATLVPLSEYLATTYHPDREYVDGVVEERNVGERDHSRTQSRLIQYLMNREDDLEFGVCYIRVLEPWTKRAYVYTADGMQEAADGYLSTADPEITVPLSEILK